MSACTLWYVILMKLSPYFYFISLDVFISANRTMSGEGLLLWGCGLSWDPEVSRRLARWNGQFVERSEPSPEERGREDPGNKKAGSGRHRGKCWLWDGLKVLYMGLGPRGMVWGARREEGSVNWNFPPCSFVYISMIKTLPFVIFFSKILQFIQILRSIV